jgi:hypothetical protein
MRKWIKKENQDAKDFHGKRTPRSGGLWSFKGDIKSDRFLIESKQTEKKGFTITKKLWNKIYQEAIESRKLPLLSIQIDDVDIVVLDKNDLLMLLEGNGRNVKNN